jgi:hypothetical protein
VTPHDTSATAVAGRSLSTFTAEASLITLCSEKVPSFASTLSA